MKRQSDKEQQLSFLRKANDLGYDVKSEIEELEAQR